MFGDDKDVKNVSDTSAETQSEDVLEEPEIVEDTQDADSSTAEDETQLEAPSKKGEETDEDGVPWKNRAMEWRRKSEELSSSLPDVIEKKLKEVLQNQQPKTEQKPKYTIAQLEAFALQNPDNRPWAEEEKEKIRMELLSQSLDEKLTSREKVREAESKKNQALGHVMKNFPDLFNKDKSGNFSGWNADHPMTIEIGKIMSDPRISNDPEGLLLATELAHSRFIRQQVPKLQTNKKQLTQKVKKLEKQTFVEGGGKQVQTGGKDPLKEAQLRLAQTGSRKDAESAVSHYLKKIGLLNE